MKVLLDTHLDSASGYGNDGIGIAQALMRWGCDVRLLPRTALPPWPPSIAMLMTKPIEPPFDLHLMHVPPYALEMTEGARKASDCSVGWTMWEFTNFDNVEPEKRAGIRERLSSFDAVVGYDKVSTGALAEETDVSLGTLQGGYDPTGWEPVERDWNGPLRFIMVGQLHRRKNPFLAIEAFKALKDEHGAAFDAELHLKTNIIGLHPSMEQWCPGLKIICDYWPISKLREFYADSHVLLAPSVGEGKNLPALEFQSTGGAVIATDFGGHQQWLHPSYNYSLPCTLGPPFPEFPNCLAAQVDVEALKERMWHVYTHRSEARTKGEAAARYIPQTCSWDAVIEKLWDRIPEWCPGEQGLLVKVKAQAAHREQVRT